MAKKPVTIEHLDASIARWKTQLRRSVNMIDKLEKQRKRLSKPRVITDMREITKAPKKPEPLAVTIMREIAAPDPTPVKVAEIDTSIPTFLQRKPLDPVAAEIKAEQDATKRRKAVGRIAKMKAKKSGETRKMPLSGKAALDAIRNG